MITICHPVDDMELMLIQMELEADGIPYFVVGQHFGSLYPGIQIPSYNERSVRVPVSRAGEAHELIRRLRESYEPTCVNLGKVAKLRMLFETFVFGWSVPAGKKMD